MLSFLLRRHNIQTELVSFWKGHLSDKNLHTCCHHRRQEGTRRAAVLLIFTPLFPLLVVVVPPPPPSLASLAAGCPIQRRTGCSGGTNSQSLGDSDSIMCPCTYYCCNHCQHYAPLAGWVKILSEHAICVTYVNDCCVMVSTNLKHINDIVRHLSAH